MTPLKFVFDQYCKQIFFKADIITGITNSFVQWGFDKAKKTNNNNKSFPLAYETNSFLPYKLAEADLFWKDKAYFQDSSKFFICLIGSINRTINIDLVLDAAKLIKKENLKIEFVICGTGDCLEKYKQLAKDLDNVHFVGWINAPQIQVLLKRASIGLLPYQVRKDFLMSIPNKVGEYLSGGVPIISTLSGEVGNLLTKYDCGTVVNSGEDMYLSILSYYNDSDFLNSKRDNAFNAYSRFLNSDIIYTDFAEYIEEIVMNWSISNDNS